jgi:2-(1,2-epoxy-1,2-dihydrophenyl)acetyl-CoA isomerase
MSNTVLYERRGGIAIVTLNRPERMNALTRQMLETLVVRLEQARDDRDVRCVVVTGAGERAFSAGADLAPSASDRKSDRPAPETLEESIDELQRWQRSSWLVHTMPKPTVAAINGACAGAALSLACACDFRLAVEGAVLATAFARVGFSGDFGGGFFMTQLVGTAKARELYMLGDRVDASEALALGLVTRVFGRDVFRKEVDAFADRLADSAPLSQRYMKRNLNLALPASLPQVLDLEAEAMMRTGRSEDFAAGTAAFLEKRKPAFLGR